MISSVPSGVSKHSRTVGVIGGLGPEATLDFYAKVLSLTPAARDQDHLHLIIDSNPKIPNRNDAVAGTGPSPAAALTAMAVGLERAGADFLVMVCNAAHAWQRDIEAAVSVPLLSLIEATCDATTRAVAGVAQVGVLGSSGCLDAGLYQDAFDERGVRALVLEGEAREQFMTLLYRVKAGDKGANVRAEMQVLAQTLTERGAEAIVAGCTEVPLVLFQSDLPCPLVDSTDALARCTLEYAGYRLPLDPSRRQPADDALLKKDD